MTTEIYVQTQVGRERSTIYRLLEASQNVKEIVSVKRSVVPGCIGLTVSKGDFEKIGIPDNTRAALERIPGVVKVLDASAAM